MRMTSRTADAINQDGDAFVAAELKKAVKAIGKNPASDFERGLVQAQKLFDETKKLKSGIKTKRNCVWRRRPATRLRR